MNRLLYALAVGLVGAALLHVAIMLALPGIAADNAWRRLARSLPSETPSRLGDENPPAEQADPFFRVVLCRFDLRDGPLLVTANGRSPFWSAAVFTPNGRPVASINSAMTGDEAPNLLILTPDRIEEGAAAGGSFQLVADAGEALLALRLSVPDESWAPVMDALASSVRCRSRRRDQ